MYSAAQKGNSNADGPPQGADISGKPRDKMQKTKGKDMQNAAHFNNAKKPPSKPVHLAYQHTVLINVNL